MDGVWGSQEEMDQANAAAGVNLYTQPDPSVVELGNDALLTYTPPRNEEKAAEQQVVLLSQPEDPRARSSQLALLDQFTASQENQSNQSADLRAGSSQPALLNYIAASQENQSNQSDDPRASSSQLALLEPIRTLQDHPSSQLENPRAGPAQLGYIPALQDRPVEGDHPYFAYETSPDAPLALTGPVDENTRRRIAEYDAKVRAEQEAMDTTQATALRAFLDDTQGAVFRGPAKHKATPFGRGFAGNPQGWQVTLWESLPNPISDDGTTPYQRRMWHELKRGRMKCVATKSGYFPMCHSNVTVCLMRLPPTNNASAKYKSTYHWMVVASRDDVNPDPYVRDKSITHFTSGPFHRFTQLLNHTEVEDDYHILDLHFQCASASDEDNTLTPLDPTQERRARDSRAWASEYLQMPQVDDEEASRWVASLLSSLQVELVSATTGDTICVDAQLTEFALATRSAGHVPQPADWVTVEHHSLFEDERNLRTVVGTAGGTKTGARTPGNLRDSVARTDVSRPSVIASALPSFFMEGKNTGYSVQIQPSRHSTAIPWWNDREKQARRAQAIRAHRTREEKNPARSRGRAQRADPTYGPRRGLTNFPQEGDDKHYVLVAFHGVAQVPADPLSVKDVREVMRRPAWVEHPLSPHLDQNHWVGLGPLVAVVHNPRAPMLGLVGPSASVELQLPDGDAEQHVKAIHWMNPEEAMVIRTHSKHPILFLNSANSVHSRTSLTSGTTADPLGYRVGIAAPLNRQEEHRGSNLASIESLFNTLASSIFQDEQEALHRAAHTSDARKGAYELQRQALAQVKTAVPATGIWCATTVCHQPIYQTTEAMLAITASMTTTLFARVGLLTPNSEAWSSKVRARLGLTAAYFNKGAVCISQPTLVDCDGTTDPQVEPTFRGVGYYPDAMRRAVTMGTRQACLTGVPVVIEQRFTVDGRDRQEGERFNRDTPLKLRFSGSFQPPTKDMKYVSESAMRSSYVLDVSDDVLRPGEAVEMVQEVAEDVRASMLLDLRVPRAGRAFIEVGDVDQPHELQASCTVRVYFVPDETRAVSLIAPDGRENLRTGKVSQEYTDEVKSRNMVVAASQDGNDSFLRETARYSRLALPGGFLTLVNRTDMSAQRDVWRLTPLGFATTLATALLERQALPSSSYSKDGRSLKMAGLDTLIGDKTVSLNADVLAVKPHICATKYLWSAVYPALSHFRTPEEIKYQEEKKGAKKLARPDVLRLRRSDTIDTDTMRDVVLTGLPASHPPLPGLMEMDLRGAAGVTAMLWAGMKSKNIWSFKQQALTLMRSKSEPHGKPFTRLLAPALGAPLSAEWLMLFTPVPTSTVPRDEGQPTGITAFWAGVPSASDFLPPLPRGAEDEDEDLGPDDAATQTDDEERTDDAPTDAVDYSLVPVAGAGAGVGADNVVSYVEQPGVPSPGYEDPDEPSQIEYQSPPRLTHAGSPGGLSQIDHQTPLRLMNAAAGPSPGRVLPFSPAAPVEVVLNALSPTQLGMDDKSNAESLAELRGDNALASELNLEDEDDEEETQTDEETQDEPRTPQDSDPAMTNGKFDRDRTSPGARGTGYLTTEYEGWGVDDWDIDEKVSMEQVSGRQSDLDKVDIDESVTVLGKSLMAEFAVYRALVQFEYRLLQQIYSQEDLSEIPVYTVVHLRSLEPPGVPKEDRYVLVTPVVRKLLPPLDDWPRELVEDSRTLQAWPTALGVPHAIFDDIGSQYAPERHKYLQELRHDIDAPITLRIMESALIQILQTASKKKCGMRLAFPRIPPPDTRRDVLGRTVPRDPSVVVPVYQPDAKRNVIPTSALLRVMRVEQVLDEALSFYVNQLMGKQSRSAGFMKVAKTVGITLGVLSTPAEVLVCDKNLGKLFTTWGAGGAKSLEYYQAPEFPHRVYYGLMDFHVNMEYALILVQNRVVDRDQYLALAGDIKAPATQASAKVPAPGGVAMEVMSATDTKAVLRVSVPLDDGKDVELWTQMGRKGANDLVAAATATSQMVPVMPLTDPGEMGNNWALKRVRMAMRLAHMEPPSKHMTSAVQSWLSVSWMRVIKDSVIYRRLYQRSDNQLATAPAAADMAERDLMEPVGEVKYNARAFLHHKVYVALRALGELQVQTAHPWNHVQEAQFLLGDAQVRTAVSHVSEVNIPNLHVYRGDPLAPLGIQDTSKNNALSRDTNIFSGVEVPEHEAAWFSWAMWRTIDAQYLSHRLQSSAAVAMEAVYPRVRRTLRQLAGYLGKSLLETALRVTRWDVDGRRLQFSTSHSDPMVDASAQALVRPLCLILFQMSQAVQLDQWDAFIKNPSQPALDEQKESKSLVAAGFARVVRLFVSPGRKTTAGEREAAAVQEVRALRTDLLRATLYLLDPKKPEMYLKPGEHNEARALYRRIPPGRFTKAHPRPVSYALDAHMGKGHPPEQKTLKLRTRLLRIWVLAAYLHLRRHLVAMKGQPFTTTDLIAGVLALPAPPPAPEVEPVPSAEAVRSPGMQLHGVEAKRKAAGARRQAQADEAARRQTQEEEAARRQARADEEELQARLEHLQQDSKVPPAIPPLPPVFPPVRADIGPSAGYSTFRVASHALTTYGHPMMERTYWGVVIGPAASFEKEMKLDVSPPDPSALFHVQTHAVSSSTNVLSVGRPRGYELASNGDREFTTIVESHLMLNRNPVIDLSIPPQGALIVESLQPWLDKDVTNECLDSIVYAYLFTRLMAPFEFQRCFKAVVAFLLQKLTQGTDMHLKYKVQYDTRAQIDDTATLLAPASAAKYRKAMYQVIGPRAVEVIMGPNTMANEITGGSLLALCNLMASSGDIFMPSHTEYQDLTPLVELVDRVLNHPDDPITLVQFVFDARSEMSRTFIPGDVARVFTKVGISGMRHPPRLGFNQKLQTTNIMADILKQGGRSFRLYRALINDYPFHRVVGEISSLRRYGVYGFPQTGATKLVHPNARVEVKETWGEPGRDYATVTPTELTEFMRLSDVQYIDPAVLQAVYANVQSKYATSTKTFKHAAAFWAAAPLPFTLCSTGLPANVGSPAQERFWQQVLLASYRCTVPPSFARYDTALPGFLYVMADGLSFCRVRAQQQIQLPYVPPMMLIPVPTRPRFDLMDFVMVLMLRYVTQLVHNEQIEDENRARLVGLGPVPDREVFSWWVRHREFDPKTRQRITGELDPRLWVMWTEMLARKSRAALELDTVLKIAATQLRVAVTAKAGTSGRLHWDREQAMSAHVGYHRDSVGCKFVLPAYLGVDDDTRRREDAALRQRRARQYKRENTAAEEKEAVRLDLWNTEEEVGDDTLNNLLAQGDLDNSIENYIKNVDGRVVSLPHMSKTHRQQNTRLRQEGLPVAARVSARPSMLYLSYQSEMDAYLPTYAKYIIRSMYRTPGFQQADMYEAQAYVATVYSILYTKVEAWDKEAARY